LSDFKVMETTVRNKTAYYIQRCSDFGILRLPTKYLKHKILENRSPNTGRRIAYGLCYYMAYLQETGNKATEVLMMSYFDQNAHFTGFLNWIVEGRHNDRTALPNNNTANQYLQSVFGFYEFLLIDGDTKGDIKVLEERGIGYSGTAGVRFCRNIKSFKGYLPKEEHVGRITDKDSLEKLLEASDSLRNKLIIILIAETGFRINELLGVRYTKDIDYEKKTIKVKFREDNKNEARAKNAEEREARISNETFEILNYYLSEYRHLLNKTKYLFVVTQGRTKGEPLTANAVYSALGVLERRTGIKVTPHMIRHYFANERRKANWDIALIQKSLGHKHRSTTEKYLHVEDDEMIDAQEEFLANNKGLYDIGKLI